MQISRITCYEVLVPAHPGVIASESIHKPLHKLPVGAKSGWTVQFDELPKLIIRLELQDGQTGWGELYRNHDWNMVQSISESLLGKDIDHLHLQKLPFTYCREYDGFECAVYDAYCRRHEIPLVNLLGGSINPKVRIGAWSSHRTSDEIGAWSAQYHHQGYDCIKFKTDLEDDVVRWAREIEEHAPGMQIILDPNERWEYGFETRKRIDSLKEVGNVLCLEDPIPRWQLSEYAKLRQYGPIPVVLHVSLPYILHGQRVQDAIRAIQMDAVDGFNFNGGIAHFMQLAHIAEAAQKPFWHGSEVDLGILEAMYLHCSAASALCIWPGDIFGRMIREHDLLKKPLHFAPPYAYLPEGNGLGIEVDEEAIQHYQTGKKVYHL